MAAGLQYSGYELHPKICFRRFAETLVRRDRKRFASVESTLRMRTHQFVMGPWRHARQGCGQAALEKNVREVRTEVVAGNLVGIGYLRRRYYERTRFGLETPMSGDFPIVLNYGFTHTCRMKRLLLSLGLSVLFVGGWTVLLSILYWHDADRFRVLSEASGPDSNITLDSIDCRLSLTVGYDKINFEAE